MENPQSSKISRHHTIALSIIGIIITGLIIAIIILFPKIKISNTLSEAKDLFILDDCTGVLDKIQNLNAETLDDEQKADYYGYLYKCNLALGNEDLSEQYFPQFLEIMTKLNRANGG